MTIETNTKPLTMTFEEFSQATNALAQKCEGTPPYSQERANVLDEIGNLFTEQGFKVLGQTWHDAARYCRQGYRTLYTS